VNEEFDDVKMHGTIKKTDIAVELDGPPDIKNTHQNIYLIYNTKRKKI
jgi:hypothetical protein